MKRTAKLIMAVLLILSIAAMLLPVASFKDNSAGAMEEDIAKQLDKVQRAETQLENWKANGKDQKSLDKQAEKVKKEQDKLQELYDAQAALAGENEALSYRFMDFKLPEELEIDKATVNAWLINGSPLFNTNYTTFSYTIWAVIALLALAAIVLFIPGNKLQSPWYTVSSILNLMAMLVTVYNLLRLAAYPAALPYASASISALTVILLLVLPAAALIINIQMSTNTKRTMIYFFCILLSILAILPFWIMIVNATRSSQQIQQKVSVIPSHFFSYNWNVLKNKNFDILVGMKNSAIIAFGSTLLSVYFSALTAYGFKVYDFKGNKFLYAVVMGIIMIPGQVTGTGFYMFMYRLGLTNNYIPLVVPSIAAAGTVFFFRQYLEANFQVSLVEAARIDGAREFFTFNRITLPIMMPAMATMGIMAVIGSWNNYMTPLMLLSKPEMKTLPMMVKELRGDIYRTEYGSIYLGLTMTALPLIIVYFALSKYIIAGVALGGVKE